MKDAYKNIRYNLKTIRKLLGASQQEMAEYLGYEKADSIGDFERGTKNNLNLNHFQTIAELLYISIGTLIDYKLPRISIDDLFKENKLTDLILLLFTLVFPEEPVAEIVKADPLFAFALEKQYDVFHYIYESDVIDENEMQILSADNIIELYSESQVFVNESKANQLVIYMYGYCVCLLYLFQQFVLEDNPDLGQQSFKRFINAKVLVDQKISEHANELKDYEEKLFAKIIERPLDECSRISKNKDIYDYMLFIRYCICFTTLRSSEYKDKIMDSINNLLYSDNRYLNRLTNCILYYTQDIE